MASIQSNHQIYTFQHPELGSITGVITPSNVVQFRAVPYATIPARFARSVLLDQLADTNNIHTAHGYHGYAIDLK